MNKIVIPNFMYIGPKTILILFTLLLYSCGHSDNAIVNIPGNSIDSKINGLERKEIKDVLKTSGGCIDVVDDSLEYMPSYTRISKRSVISPEIAWEELKNLYPDFAGKIKCWTEYHEHYVFSIGFNDPKTDCMFWHILYVKKGGSEFRYFWPHT